MPVLILFLILLCLNLFFKDHKATFNETQGPPVVVIDPGHGGKDPGKVGVNDALEKDINLEIALHLKTYLEEKGIKVVMTREEDKGLYSEGARNKKREDMRARADIANACNPVLVVSIHQNSYQESSCKGAQVFYYEGSENGLILAEYIQAAMINHVDPDNKRNIKANKSYYLLKEISVAAVIVECGFLSNPQEADLLAQEAYQGKVAEGIGLGIMEFLGK